MVQWSIQWSVQWHECTPYLFLGLGLTKLLNGTRNEEKGKTAIADLQPLGRPLSRLRCTWPRTIPSSPLPSASRVWSASTISSTPECAPQRFGSESTGHEETIQLCCYPSQKAKRAVLTRRAYPHFRRLVGRVQLDLVQPAFACALDKGTGDFTDRILVSKLLSQFYTLELSKEGDDG
ncbi:hypothetical protein BM221_008584 [Beauveria bassiana]|uniref:Uncharacterized protein n=1 Tax=Beauveria bassiana TaxID=176275 RepID=A0A2N6ND82_BEABA|nr:hypothetical protein BM221_008584 [Beauveria bassiana]